MSRSQPQRLRLEPLEDRRLLSITVNTLLDEADGSLERAVELIYLRAFTRLPTEEEREIGLQAIEGWPARLEADAEPSPRAATAKWLAVANYSHALLNSAEFSFID